MTPTLDDSNHDKDAKHEPSNERTRTEAQPKEAPRTLGETVLFIPATKSLSVDSKR